MLGFQVTDEENSDKNYSLLLFYFIYTFQVKEFILDGKILYLRFAPSQKSASFESAPPHELLKLTEHPRHSFDQVR